MYYSQNFKEKIGEPVSGGTQPLGTFTKLGEWLTDTQITQKFNIEPLSIPDFWATIENMIDTLNKKVYGYLFYVKATDGRALTVGAFWSGDQWGFSCGEFDGNGWWGAERCVFSPAITLNPSSPSKSEPVTLDHAIEIVKQAGFEVVGQVICETCNGTGKIEKKK